MALDRFLGRFVELAKSLTSHPASPPQPAPAVRPRPPEVEAEAVPWEASHAPTQAAEPEEAELLSPEEARSLAKSEPFPTRTMAQILAAQGEKRRALAIYEALVAKTPDDAGLVAEAAAVRRALATTPPPARRDEDEVTATQEVVAVHVDATSVLVSWEVSDAGIARAKRLLPEARGLAARLVVVSPDAADVIATNARQRTVERAGEWLVAGLAPGSYATAAIGLVDGERFVSIAHAKVLAPAA